MERIALSDAKAHLSDLVTRTARGEEIEITRHGKVVARLTPPHRRSTLDVEALRRFTASMPAQPVGAAEAVRRVRDDGF